MAYEKQDQHDTYIIPPNFIESGTIMGGMFKMKNAIEAAILAGGVGLPVFNISVSLTYKIILLCLTALPLVLLALIGIGGESLSSFILNFFKFLINRRVVGSEKSKYKLQGWNQLKAKFEPKPKTNFISKSVPTDDIRALKRQLKETKKVQKQKKSVSDKCQKDTFKAVSTSKKNKNITVAEYLNIEKIENGIIYTKDHRFIKFIEVIPINFLLRSAREQRNIIYSFISFLKISPIKLQFKVLTKKADINKHLENVRADIEKETDDKCKVLQRDYEKLIQNLGSKEAVARRFLISFEYEPIGNRRGDELEAVATLQTVARTARTFLLQCGNEVVTYDNEDEEVTNILYNILNRKTNAEKPLSEQINEVIGKYVARGETDKLDEIPVSEFIAPKSIDFTHGRYILMDGVYHSYMLIPSGGYKSRVSAGWLSLLVNAGEGIDVDIFVHRQPKDRIMHKLGQQLRINRSKIKDASDTNIDFDDIEGAIKSGYFLKEGITNNEDFYYMTTLITVTAESLDELEWRIAEMKKLLISQDLEAVTCSFRQEQAFNSAMPLNFLDKKLFERSKRNMLTSGIASCYPFTSYEMCDDNGILLGVNKHNNSLVIVDIFNSLIYKNANIAIIGTSGGATCYGVKSTV